MRLGGIAALGAGALVLFVAACGRAPTDASTAPHDTRPKVFLNVQGAVPPGVAGIAVNISGADIASYVEEIPVRNDSAQGTLSVPAGSGRILIFHAFDPAGIETHRATDTVSVLPGANVVLAVQLEPIAGGSAIALGVATVVVQITPADTATTVGGHVHLAAQVTDGSGQTVAGARVVWASTVPGIATVDTAGWVVGTGAGIDSIVATVGGASAVATVTVTP